MVDRIRNIIARFSENEEVIRDMIKQNRDFDALCDEYAQSVVEIDECARSGGDEAAARAAELQERRMRIEEEILTAIEGYAPA